MENGMMSGVKIELTSNRQAIVDGSDAVIDFNDEKIMIRAGRMTIHFLGRDLKLKLLTVNSTVIEGYIKSVEYIY